MTKNTNILKPIKAFVNNASPFNTEINGTTISKLVFSEQMTAWDLIQNGNEFVFESHCGQHVVSPSKNTKEFNDICQEILEIDAGLKGEPYPPCSDATHAVVILEEDFDLITIDKLTISPEVFKKQLTKWRAHERRELTHWLEYSCEQNPDSTFNERMEEDMSIANELKQLSDSVILEERGKHIYLSPSKNPNEWDQACREILKAHHDYENDSQ
ncbi:hypothetical protein [Vibrio owensii]|uniref:hypothetical protein n=1 Tax=Vibrio owensii TaxID=696485 RepID=UPI003CC52277